MAARAAHSYGGMDECFAEERFVMATVAQVRLLHGEALCDFVRYFMRHASGIDRRMTGGTTHGKGGMDGFPFGEFFMALKAVHPGSGRAR
jgi:hypothetical protein